MMGAMRLPIHRHSTAVLVTMCLAGSALIAGIRAQSGAGQAAAAQTPAAYRTAMEQADLAIQKENKDHSELMKNEEYLTTEIGPRLTGGKEMQAATAWTVQRVKDYGLDAHAEDASVDRAWYPGVDTAEIIAPWHKVITIRAEAYSKTTCPDNVATTDAKGNQNAACEITAPVMLINPGDTPTADQVKGKIVLQNAPTTNNMDPDYQADNAYDAVIVPARGVPGANARGGTGGRAGGGGGAARGGAA